jgi:hypothetical protein
MEARKNKQARPGHGSVEGNNLRTQELNRGRKNQMRVKLAIVVIGISLLLSAVQAPAHHGFAATFDSTKPISVKGVVTKVELMNPHSWLWMDVKSSDGTVVNWGFEGGSPNSLIRHGVTKGSVPLGSEIIVEGYQVKSGESKGVATGLTFSDGRKLFFGGSTPDIITDPKKAPK